MVLRKAKKGIVGIEAAIVLIAFVIVAAALAFVTLNMGFFTTQKSQQVIASGLGEASSALEVDGSVLAYSESGSTVNFMIIPLKVSPGREAVDLSPKRAAIIYWLSDVGSFADIYQYYGFINYDNSKKAYVMTIYNSTGGELFNDTDKNKGMNVIGTSINTTAIYQNITKALDNHLGEDNKPDVVGILIWTDYNADDTSLDLGEKAILMVIFYDDNVKPGEYDLVKFEIKPPTGAPLTVEKTMPPGISQGVIDLG